MKFFKILWAFVFLAFSAFAQEDGIVRFGAGDTATRGQRSVRFGDEAEVAPRAVPPTVDMLEYIIPAQAADSEKQFHLEGYMQCLGIPGSACLVGGEPFYSRGSFQKQTKSIPDKSGNIRLVSSKARTGLLAYPCEYHETRDEYDEAGRPIRILYLREEMMDWVYNKQYRAYYDGLNEPLFEWGRSRAVEGRFYLQEPRFEIRHRCDNTVSTVPVTIQGYIVRVYSLEGNLEEVNRRMGSMGPVEPKWVDMAHAMGQKAELLVIESYWGWTPSSPGAEAWRWRQRELYMYLRGVGWVSWRWQEHENGQLQNPFVTHKVMNLDSLVWEKPGEFVRNVELCEELPVFSQNVQTVMWQRESAARSEIYKPSD